MDGIDLQEVGKRFGDQWALHGVTLSVPPGRIMGVLGRNGAGKTTLMRILATSVLPDRGRAVVGGVDVVADPVAARARAGLVLGEDRSHFWRLSGRQNLEFFAALVGLRGERARGAVGAALAEVGLASVGDRRVDRYSTGMRSRLALARALLGRPAVVLADEPTRSLDPASAADVRRLLRRLAAQEGAAILVATHDMHEAAELADQTVVLAGGSVVRRFDRPVEPAQLAAAVEPTPAAEC